MPSKGVATSGPHRKPGARLLWRVVILCILGGGVYLLAPLVAEVPHIVAVLRRMAWPVLAVAAVMQALSYVSSAYLLIYLLPDSACRPPLAHALAIILAAGSVGMVAGGVVGVAAAMARWLRTYRLRRGDALIAGLLMIYLDDVVIMGVAIAGLVHLLSRRELSWIQAAGAGLVLGSLMLVLATAALAQRYPTRFSHVLARGASFVARLLRSPVDAESLEARIGHTLGVWQSRPAAQWLRPVATAAGAIGFDMLTLLALFTAAGYPVSPGLLLLGYGVPILLGKLSFLPNGVGLVEVSMTALYGSLGVPHEVLVVVILVYRVLSFWLPALLGFVLTPFLDRRAELDSEPA